MVKTNWEHEEANPGCSPEVSALHTPRPSAHNSLQLVGLAQSITWHKHHNHGANPPRLTFQDLAEWGLGKFTMSRRRGVPEYEDVLTSVQAHEIAA